MQNRIIATLNISSMDSNFLDKSFYKKAVGAGSLRSSDYLLSRVSNNPSYSNNLLKEIREDSYPTFDRVAILNNSHCTTPENQLTSNRSSQAEQNTSIDFGNHVDNIVSLICEHKYRNGLLKILSYFLISSGNHKTSHPYLNHYLKYFRNLECSNWASCIKLVGTRWTAETYREEFRGLYSDYIQGVA